MSTRDFQSVLYVDDDADICSVVRATLRLVPGLQVRTADSGKRAIDLALEFRPDLVLMDVMMPGLDGPSTLKRMRESLLLADIPVVFMTAKVLPAEISQFLQMGAIGVIVKPFDPLKLYSELLALWDKGGTARQGSVTDGGQSIAQAQIDSLTINFLQRAWADVINLATMIERAQKGERSVLREIERVSHSLHGAGAMFGFPKISEMGGTMARIVQGLAESAEAHSSACEPATLQQLLELSKQLAQEVEVAWQTAPESAAMFQAPVGVR
ncbi:MAG TPA: response regulator [Steroidobacteraceae bacterium]|nr:response regulator [Steroidobacteraceae bacterium]